MSEMLTLHPHDTALSRPLKQVYLKAAFPQIQHREQKLLHIGVVPAVQLDRVLRFAFRL